MIKSRNGVPVKSSHEQLKMTHHLHTIFQNTNPTNRSPSLHFFDTPRKEGQPDFYHTKENFIKIKHSFGTIPEFALKPLSPRALIYSERASKESFKPVLNENFGDQINNKRYSPGMIGWGVERRDLIDRQALTSNKNFDKPILYGIDKTRTNNFTKTTGKLAAKFDRDFGVDLEIYKNLNTAA